MNRTLVIGDIHGCFDELLLLLEKADLAAGDRVFGVGDLIVKGPKNREVLDLFSGDPRFSAVIGNHDLAILNFWRGQVDFLKNSQKQTCVELEKYSVSFQDGLRTDTSRICDDFVEIDPAVNLRFRSETNNYGLEQTLLKTPRDHLSQARSPSN